jgi:hypothetical protein
MNQKSLQNFVFYLPITLLTGLKVIYSQNDTKHINAFCGQNTNIFKQLVHVVTTVFYSPEKFITALDSIY